MKKYFLLSIVLLSFLLAPLRQANAEVPKTLNYQGRLLNSEAEGLDQTLPITFEFYDSEFGGVKLWSETQNVSIVDGYFNVVLGEDVPINLAFDQTYWLQVRVADEAPYPRTALTQVPNSIRAILSDSAEYSLKLVEGALTIAMMSDEARTVTGGDVIGTYPELFLRDGAVIENIGEGTITGEMLSPNVTTPPIGPASGDLTGNYPDPLIAEGAVVENRIADDAVTLRKLYNAEGPAGTILGWDGEKWIETDVATWEIDGVIGNEVLDATTDRGLVRAGAGTTEDPYTLGIMDGGVTNDMLAGGITADKFDDGAITWNLIEPGTTRGQIAWWDGTAWTLTGDMLPQETQVLKWVYDENEQTTKLAWADDDFTIPYHYEGGSTDDMDNGVTMLKLILNDADNLGQHVIHAEVADDAAGSAIYARGSGVVFDQGKLPVIDAYEQSDQAFFNGVIKGVADVATIHNGGSYSGYFEHNATATSHVNSLSAGVMAANNIDAAIDNTDHIGVLATATAGGGEAWGVAGLANGEAMNNIGVVGYGVGAANNNWGVLGLSNNNPTALFEGADANYNLPNLVGVVALNDDENGIALYAESINDANAIEAMAQNANAVNAMANGADNPTLYAENTGTGPAAWLLGSNPATDGFDNTNSVAAVINDANGRALYVEGGSENNENAGMPYFADPMNNDDAALTVVNTAYQDGATWGTAIKTYGDIWANSAVGASQLVGLDVLTLTTGANTYDPADPLTFGEVSYETELPMPETSDGSAVWVNDDLLVQENFYVAGDVILHDVEVDNLLVNEDLNVEGITTLDETTVDVSLDVTGTLTQSGGQVQFGGNVDALAGLDVTGVTNLQETNVVGPFDVTGVTTLDQTTIDGQFDVNGPTTLTGTLTQSGGQVEFDGNVNADNGLDVTGLFTVDGNSELTGDLDVSGVTTLGSGDAGTDLIVDWDATVENDLLVGNDLTVNGNADLFTASVEELTVETWLDLGTNDAEFIVDEGNWDFGLMAWNAPATGAGVSGDFLVSQGPGMSPIWTNSAPNLELDVAIVRTEFWLDADGAPGPIDVQLTSNSMLFNDADVTIGNASGTRGNLTVENDLFVDDEATIVNDLNVTNGNFELLLGNANVYTGNINQFNPGASVDVWGTIVNTNTGTVVVDDNLTINEVTTAVGNIDAQANIINTLTGTVVVDDNLDVNETLNVDLTSTLVGTVDAQTSIVNTITDIVVVDDNLTINEVTTAVGNIDAQAAIENTLTGTVVVDDNLNVAENLDVDGDTEFGTVPGPNYVQLNEETQLNARQGAVEGPGNAGDLLVSRGAGLNPEWTVSIPLLNVDDLNVNNLLTLDADGDAAPGDVVLDILNGSVQLQNGNLDLLNGNAAIDGDLTANTASFGVDNAGIDLNVDWDAVIGNDLEVGNDLNVNNDVNIDMDLDVDGMTTLDNTEVEGTFNVIGVTTLDQTTVDGLFTVNGNSDLNGTLNVQDLATFQNDVTVEQDLTVQLESNLQGNVNAGANVNLTAGNLTLSAPNTEILMNASDQEINMTGNNASINLTNPNSTIDIYGSIVNTDAGQPVLIGDNARITGNLDVDNYMNLSDNDQVNEIFTSLDGDLTIALVTDEMLVTAKAVQDALGNIPEDGSGTNITDTDSDGRNEVNLGGPLYADVVIDGDDVPDAGLITGAAPYNVTFQDLATFNVATPTANITTTNTNIEGLVTVTGNVVPNATNTYDLGTNLLRWNDLYLNGASLHIGDVVGTEAMITYAGGTTTLDIDGTDVMTATATQVDFSQNVDANDGLDVIGDNLTVGGANFTVDPANGNTTIEGTVLDPTGALTVADDFVVTGTSNLQGNVDIDSDLNVDGTSTLVGTTTISGKIELGVSGTGNAYADFLGTNNNMNVVIGADATGNNGAISVQDAAGANMAGMFYDGTNWYNGVGNPAAEAAGFVYDGVSNAWLQIQTGPLPADVTFQVDNAGEITSPDDNVVNIDDALDVTGNVDANSNLTVDGATILGDGADLTTINGPISQTGALNDVDFQGNVDANNGLDVDGGNLNVANDANITGNANVTGNLDVDGSSSLANNNVLINEIGTVGEIVVQTDGGTNIAGLGPNGAEYGLQINEVATGNQRAGIGYYAPLAGWVAGVSNDGDDLAGVITSGADDNMNLRIIKDGGQTFNVDVDGNVNFDGTMTQAAGGGQVTFEGNVDANAGLDVDGGNFTVGSGPAEFTVDFNNGNTLIDGTLRVNGEADFRSDIVNNGGTVNINDDLAVTGTTNLNSTTTLGTSTGAKGTLVLNDDDAVGAETVTITAPDVTASYTVTLPPAQGAANQVLLNDGAGNLSWSNMALSLQDAYDNSANPAVIALAAGKEIQITNNNAGTENLVLTSGAATDAITLDIANSGTNSGARITNSNGGNSLLITHSAGGDAAISATSSNTASGSHGMYVSYNPTAPAVGTSHALVVETPSFVNTNSAAALIQQNGINATATGLEVNSTAGAGIVVSSSANYAVTATDGGIKVSTGTVAAGAAIAIPTGPSYVVVTDDGGAAANLTSMAGLVAADAGRILYITNNDAQPLIGTFPVPNGATWKFIYDGTGWHHIQ